MTSLHQLYLTHCTGGTSAIERRTGEGAERKLGLSARASSLLQDDLRRHFPALSRLVSYALPADAGPEVRAKYTSESAPRRLVFHPQFHGWQVCTQVVFQPSTGKSASPLFAHLVGAELAAAAPPLTALAALQLWQAPGWVEDEPAGLGFDLPCLTDWSELARPPGATAATAARPAIRDDLFRTLLTAAPQPPAPSDRPGIVPERWRVMPTHQRVELFRRALRGYLAIAERPREAALLVIEPAMAAVFFYGIARLLPPGPLRDGLSFSTYEPYTDRLCTNLAATCFHDVARGDVKPERYQRGFVLNTFLGGKATPLNTPHPYADFIVDTLLQGGWPAVDRILAAAQAAQVASKDQLIPLVAGYQAVRDWLDPTRQPDPELLRQPEAAATLGAMLADELSRPVDDVRLQALARTADRRAHWILRTIASHPPVGSLSANTQRLMDLVPEEQLEKLLQFPEIPAEAKVALLVRFVTRCQRMPHQCDYLFDWGASAASPAPTASSWPSLVAQFLRSLPSDTLRELVDCVSKEHQAALFVCLAEAFGPQDDNQKLLRRLALQMHFEPLSIALERLGDRTDLLAPDTRRELGLRFVQHVLNPIHQLPAEFLTRVTWLQRARPIIAELAESQQPSPGSSPSWAPIQRADAWCEVPQIIQQARASAGTPRRGRSTRVADSRSQVGQRLADALSRALPLNPGTQVTPSDKAVGLYNILAALQATDLVSPDWKQRAAYYLDYGQWPDFSASVSVATDTRYKLVLAGVGAGIVTVLAVLFLLLSRENNQVARDRQDDPSTGKLAPSPKPTPKPVTPPPKPESKPAGGPPVTPPPTSEKPSEKPVDGKRPMEKPPMDKPPDAKPMAEKPMPRPPPGDKPEPQPAEKLAVKPASPEPEDLPEPMKGATEIAQLPAPFPGEFPFWGSPSDPAAQFKIGGELKLEWEVWSNPQERRINVDKFELHGFSLAMGPWSRTTGKSDPKRLPLDVTLTKVTPGVHAVRVTGQDGLPVELARFQIPRTSGKLLLTMDLKPRTWPSHFEIQEQILFCVVELTEDDGTSFFVALQPLFPARQIQMSRDNIAGGNIRAEKGGVDLFPCPLDRSLLRLHVVRGVLVLKDNDRYTFGSAPWIDATSASEWALKPVESAPALEKFRMAVTESGRRCSLCLVGSSAKDIDFDAAIAKCEQEIKDITDMRLTVNKGKKAKADNDRAKLLSDGAGQLCALLNIKPKLIPAPFNLRGDVRPESIQAETARVQADWRVYLNWLDKVMEAADKKRTELQDNLRELKQKRAELRKVGSETADEVRAKLDYALVELYREVPLNDGQRKVRVPVMLFPD